MVRVKYFGFLRVELVNHSEDVLLLDKDTLRDLLRHLAERYGEKFTDHVFDPSTEVLREDILLNVNGTPNHQLSGLETILSDEDEVDIMPLFSGGG